MKPLYPLIAIIVVMIEIYGLMPARPSSQPLGPRGPESHQLAGAIHVHSTFSDGSATIPEIAAAAKEAGLDFVIVTDHNNSRARAEGFEKNYDGVDVFVEMEVETAAGHLLTFFSQSGMKNADDSQVVNTSWRQFLGLHADRDLFLAIAHPSNPKIPWNRLDRVADGVEVVNFDSSWHRQIAESMGSFLLTTIISPFNQYLAALRFIDPYRKDFSTWDDMNQFTPGKFGFLAHDIHAKLKLTNKSYLRWPDYLTAFKLASNVVTLDGPPPTDFEERKRAIYRAIRHGRLAMVYQALHGFSGSEFSLKCGEKSYGPGQTANYSESCRIIATTPSTFPYAVNYRVIRDGVPWKVQAGGEFAQFDDVTPGVYRLEVWAKTRSPFHLLLDRDVPYVFYNPVYVR